jgi:hypothetical protein
MCSYFPNTHAYTEFASPLLSKKAAEHKSELFHYLNAATNPALGDPTKTSQATHFHGFMVSSHPVVQ